MQIKKRSLPLYIFLNCITLGIYGFVVSMSVDNEINAICNGDDEEPRFSYAGAVMLRGISSFVGIVVGLIVSLVAFDKIGGGYLDFFGGYSEIKAAVVFIAMAAFGLVFTAIGSIISGIYHKYWWYKQVNRLKVNAGRYDIEVKESGTDNILFRTVAEVFTFPVTVALIDMSILIPGLLIWLITLAESTGAYVFAAILAFVFSIPLMLFGMELTTGANFATYFVFKNLNRFADVAANGAKPFDKMDYKYYLSNESVVGNVVAQPVKVEPDKIIDTVPVFKGSLVGLKGSCGGYNFELTPGEEFVIGKDAKMASIVIDPSYKEISRKHCGITYSQATDNFAIIDYSSNGTWANEIKLSRGEVAYFPKGTVIKLANDKNTFRLE